MQVQIEPIKHQKSVELVRLNLRDEMEVTHYHGRGSRTVVALPGLGSSAQLFEPLLDHLPSDCSLLILHHRGIGRSSALRDEDTLNDVASELAYFLETRSFELCQKFDLLGVSYGGFLAQLIALKSPGIFHSLALFCTTSGGPDFEPLLNITDEALITQASMDEKKRATLSALYNTSQKTQQNSELFQKICRYRCESVSLSTTLWQNAQAKDFLATPLALEFIKTPTLVISAKDDRVVPAVNGAQLAKKIPSSQFIMMEDCDHLFFMEQTRQVMKHYQKFLFS